MHRMGDLLMSMRRHRNVTSPTFKEIFVIWSSEFHFGGGERTNNSTSNFCVPGWVREDGEEALISHSH